MISEWWLAGAMVVFLVVLIWHGRMAYRHGIWDGAFNHFLPIVRQEMFRYDPVRAKALLDEEAMKGFSPDH